MNQEIISKKLFFISLFCSIFILVSLYINSLNHSRLKVWVCNSEDKINVLVQRNTYDILINPIGEKEILDCLGKVIPYFDRRIDVVFSDNNVLVETIGKRYVVRSVRKEKTFKYLNKEFYLTEGILIKENGYLTQIYQRPLHTIDLNWNNLTIDTILLSASSTIKTEILNKSMQKIMLDVGEITMLR